MLLLAIETSADETAVSIVEIAGEFPTAHYTLRGNALHSQAAMHSDYGGIYPMVAKREHAKAIVPLLKLALTEADLLDTDATDPDDIPTEQLATILEREPELLTELSTFLQEHSLPEIDAIAVTSGPGLEPALWVGVNFAKALAALLSCPVIPVNHMEGHILASVFDAVEDDVLADLAFPAIALLISGGHTELVLMTDWGSYEKIGQTRDDAVGEAFDKVARLLGLPYPGGPEIEKLATVAREAKLPPFKNKLPRPMLHSADLDFSFSGLKTAVRYAVEGVELTDADRQAIARDFSDAVAEVLLHKTTSALEQYSAQSLVIGGGVSASTHLRQVFQGELILTHPDITVYFPQPALSTDNSIMIALAGHARLSEARTAGSIGLIQADGNRSL